MSDLAGPANPSPAQSTQWPPNPDNMTPTHGTHTLAYSTLTQEPVDWLIQHWGDGLSLGWRGKTADVVKCHTLMANYDCRARGEWGVFPNAPRLQWPYSGNDGSLGYIYASEERILASLTLYFEIMISRELGRAAPERVGAISPEISHVDFDENCPHASVAHWQSRANEMSALPDEPVDEPDQSWEVDTKLVTKLAIQAAVSFIEDHIKVSTFMPDAPEPLFSQFSTGRHHDGDDQFFESLVDRAALA